MAVNPQSPKMLAGVQMIGRMGAKEFHLRFSEELPVVWTAVMVMHDGYADAASAMDPETAVTRLCERMADGGLCTHCQKPTGLTDTIDEMPLNNLVCWYQYDPEMKTYRRGCE